MLLVYGLFALLLARLGTRAPIPYVQDAILNLRHPYIVVATATTDSLCKLIKFCWSLLTVENALGVRL